MNSVLSDIRDKRLLFVKGLLFVCLGTIAAGLILIEHPTFRIAFLLCIAIWAFCRAYYFAFYVIQHYVDPQYRFAGLGSFVRYAWQNRKTTAPTEK